ncbi:MAG TPA: hypothetical protein VGD99_18300 [Anaerolineae bacterium]
MPQKSKPDRASIFISHPTASIYGFMLLLSFLFMWLHIPILKISFVSDDYVWVRDVTISDHLNDFFKETFALKDTDFRYRPLMPTTVRLCYEVSGISPFCMHLVSLILHFFNTLLTWKVSYLITKNRWAAGFAALFFATYFAHVENVAWISDLGNLLTGFLMLATVILFLRFASQRNYIFWGLSLVTFAMAMISKESALALGPILVTWGAIMYWRASDRYARKPLLIACASYGMLAGVYVLLINRTGLIFAFSGAGNYTYRLSLITLRNVLYYPLNFFWPTPVSTLELVYQHIFAISQTYTGFTQESMAAILTIPGLAWILGGTLVFWLGAAWLLWQRQLVDWLALAWLILGLLPVIFLGSHSERHMYVASIGLSLLVGSLFARQVRISRKRWPDSAALLLTTSFVIILALNIHWTHIRLRNWQVAGQTASRIITTVMNRYPNLSPESELWFVNLPDNFNDAYIFRLGIDAALQLETKNRKLSAHSLPTVDQLPPTLGLNQYAFIFEDGRLLDLTPDYR